MFLNSLMLIGVGAAVMPLVLHLLSRGRFRTVDWGAMMFLDGGDPRDQQSSRFNQIILLLIRGLIIAVLAVALARPILRGGAPTAAGQRSVAVLLLDCSASMGFDENGTTRIVHAKVAAKQVLGVHKGDPVSLVLMGQPQPAEQRLPTTDLWEVAKRVESAEPGFGRADVERALEETVAMLAARAADDAGGAGGAGGARVVQSAVPTFATIYVVADRQLANWQGMDSDAFANAWRDRLRDANVTARVIFVPVGGADADNVVVQSVELLNGPAVVNQPAEAEVRVRNHGGVQWAALPLVVSLDKRAIYEQKVSLAPNASASFRLPIRERAGKDGFAQPGTHVLSASVDTGRPGGLNADDRLDAAVEVTDPVRVLILSGDASGDQGDRPDRPDRAGRSPGLDADGDRSAAEFLQLALAPFKTAKHDGPDPCTVDVAPADAWAGPTVALPKQPGATAVKDVRLGAYQVVVLSNVERLDAAQVLAIEQFVYDGGGLLVVPGGLTRPAEYNRLLYRQGDGILPAALEEPTAADGSQQTAISGFDPQHRVFRFLKGRPDAFLPAVIGRYFPVSSRAAGARVLAQYVTGEPFLIGTAAGVAGRGRVLLLTTALDAEWTTLPTSSFYLPFAQSAVRYLADAAPRKLNLSPGEAIEAAFDGPSDGRVIRVTTPDGQDRPLELPAGAQTGVARYADTAMPGQYLVKVWEPTGKKSYTLHYVVRPPRDESDLTSVSPAQLVQLERSMGLEVVDTAERPVSEASVAARPARELWGWLLGVAFALAIVEMGLGRLWSRDMA